MCVVIGLLICSQGVTGPLHCRFHVVCRLQPQLIYFSLSPIGDPSQHSSPSPGYAASFPPGLPFQAPPSHSRATLLMREECYWQNNPLLFWRRKFVQPAHPHLHGGWSLTGRKGTNKTAVLQLSQKCRGSSAPHSGIAIVRAEPFLHHSVVSSGWSLDNFPSSLSASVF